MQFSHTLATVADASAIWTVWTDVPCWPQWDSELTSASLVGDFCLGATGQLTPKKGPVSFAAGLGEQLYPDVLAAFVQAACSAFSHSS